MLAWWMPSTINSHWINELMLEYASFWLVKAQCNPLIAILGQILEMRQRLRMFLRQFRNERHSQIILQRCFIKLHTTPDRRPFQRVLVDYCIHQSFSRAATFNLFHLMAYVS